jgi:predicted MFS family arabinose efflux permease
LFGAGGLVAFVVWEAREPQPIIDISLFKRNRAFALAIAAGLFYQASSYGVDFLVSIYLQTVKGLSPLEAGTILAVIPAVTVIFSPLTGKVSDRIEPRILASAGMGGIAVDLLFLSTLSVTTAVGVTAIHVYPKDDDTYEFYVTWLSRRPFFRSILAASLFKICCTASLSSKFFRGVHISRFSSYPICGIMGAWPLRSNATTTIFFLVLW